MANRSVLFPDARAAAAPSPPPPSFATDEGTAAWLRAQYDDAARGLLRDQYPAPADVGDYAACKYDYHGPGNKQEVFLGKVIAKYDDDTYRLGFPGQHEYAQSFSQLISRAAFHVYEKRGGAPACTAEDAHLVALMYEEADAADAAAAAEEEADEEKEDADAQGDASP